MIPVGRNIKQIEKRLQEAVQTAKSTINVPAEMIVINSVHKSHIYVEEVLFGREKWIYVFYSDAVIDIRKSASKKREVAYKWPKDKFRAMLFVGCANSRIFVMEKMLKITFLFCESCELSIRGGCIGPLEFIRSKSCKIDLRENEISVVQVDMCKDLHFYQRLDTMVYVLCACDDVTCMIIHDGEIKIPQTDMQTSMFGEQNVMLFSRTDGIAHIQSRHVLNDIGHNLFFHENRDDDVSEIEKSLASFGVSP